MFSTSLRSLFLSTTLLAAGLAAWFTPYYRLIRYPSGSIAVVISERRSLLGDKITIRCTRHYESGQLALVEQGGKILTARKVTGETVNLNEPGPRIRFWMTDCPSSAMDHWYNDNDSEVTYFLPTAIEGW